VALGGCLLASVLMDRSDTRAAEGAAEGKPLNVAVVDLFTVLKESRMYKDLLEQLKEGNEANKTEAARREEAAREAQEMTKAFHRSAPEFREKFKAFVDAAVDYNVFVRLTQSEQILLLNKGTWGVYQSILDVVKEVSKERGIDMVLYMDDFQPNLQDTEQLLAQIRQRKVLHASEKIDLSKAVLDRFNANYRKTRAKKGAAGKKGG
jgi:hypothetical protein